MIVLNLSEKVLLFEDSPSSKKCNQNGGPQEVPYAVYMHLNATYTQVG
jgi:hypothetical protein